MPPKSILKRHGHEATIKSGIPDSEYLNTADAPPILPRSSELSLDPIQRAESEGRLNVVGIVGDQYTESLTPSRDIPELTNGTTDIQIGATPILTQSLPSQNTYGSTGDNELFSTRKRYHFGRPADVWRSAKDFINEDSIFLLSSVENFLEDRKCSSLQTFMNLIKGTTGTGILTLPLAFMTCGLWAGLFGFLLVSLVAVHCMHIMVRAADVLEKRSNIHVRNYPEVMGQCLTYGPQKLQKYGPTFEKFGHILIYIMQCSFCCVYIVWIAVNVKDIVDQIWPNDLDIRVFELIVYLLLLPYVMISDLRVLAYFSALANVIYFISLVIICQYLFQDLPDSRELPAFTSWKNVPTFLGTVIFCFECVCLVVPLRGMMANSDEIRGWTGLLTFAETIVVVVYCVIGFYGYLKFGGETEAALTLNLPRGLWLYRSVTLMFGASVFLSLAVQFYVPATTLWPEVDNRLTKIWPKGYNRKVYECLTRAALLTVTLVVAMVVPHIDLLVALVGSLFGCILSMIVPALVNLITLHTEEELTPVVMVKDALIVVVGVLGLASGTYISMVDIVKSF